MSLRVKARFRLLKTLKYRYLIVREMVIFLGIGEYILLFLGTFSAGEQDYTNSLLYYILMSISYYISTKLSWKLSEWVIRLELQKQVRSKE